MKLLGLSLLSLGLFACISAAKPQRTSAASTAKSVDSSSPVLLKKIIGGLERRDATQPVYTCELRASDVSDLSNVQKLIKDLSTAKIQVAMHIVATVPSVELYAYLDGKEVLIFRDYSTLEYPAPPPSKDGSEGETRHPAALKLADILNAKCPTPKDEAQKK